MHASMKSNILKWNRKKGHVCGIPLHPCVQEVRKLPQHKKEKQKRLSLHQAIKHIDEVEKTNKNKQHAVTRPVNHPTSS